MLSVMNEVDPCLLIPLCILYEIQNQNFQHLTRYSIKPKYHFYKLANSKIPQTTKKTKIPMKPLKLPKYPLNLKNDINITET